MLRAIIAVVAGLVAWAVLVTAIDMGLRLAIPGYAAVEPTLAFTIPMMVARLAMAAAASLPAGVAVRMVAPASRWAPWAVGIVLLAAFLPAHIHIGARLPLWFHLVFLGSLVPLVVIGARSPRRGMAGAR